MRYTRLFILIISGALVCLLFSRDGFTQTPSVAIGLPKEMQDTASFKLFLIGDAGEGDTTGATLHDLRIQLLNNPNSAVIFLGDNCYVNPFFLLPVQTGGYDGSKSAQRRLMAQLNILRGYKGYVYFVPGNHDWWNRINLRRGKKRLLTEQLFIEDTLRKFITIRNHNEGTFLPPNGDPGPISRDFNNGRTRIIFIDTYRLIIEEGSRRHKDTLFLKSFYDALKAQLADATGKRQKIIVVAHHPIHSKGKHSFPLALWERLSRRLADSNTNYPPYNRVATRLDSVLKQHNRPDIYYVSGHEHSLQYFFNDSLHYLVSGAGSKVDKVDLESCMDEGECLQWNELGFFEIAFYGRKQTVLMYHRKDHKSELQVHCVAGCK